ncbi:hypothetical protein RSAG8_00666, partial [Rhizoctonia solani AG-8 WAC10335]
MKSLVALLDRKKKDRATTLVQIPFPPALPHSTVHQDGPTSIHGARRTSTPSFLRPPQQHRTASDSHVHRPLLFGSSPYHQGHPPVQNASYYTDSDDSILVDPFAPSPVKPDLTSKPHRQVYPQRGSQSSSASMLSPNSRRFRASQEPSAPLVDEPKSQSGVAASTGKKGRWLRERRSLTSLLRPQQPVPTVPPLPSRVPERKSSSFFTRARSGSTPPVTQTTEPAHTTHQRPTGPESAQLPTSANPQLRAVDTGPKNGSSYRGIVPLTLTPLSQADPPDSWVRVGGVGRDPGLPASPTTRRRAVSVPLPLSQPTKPPPPVPDVQRPQYAPKHEVDRFAVVSLEPVLMRRPLTSAERRQRPSHNAHGTKSASVSVPAPAGFNAGTRSKEQDQPAPQLSKQLSVGTAEGLVLKSALKRRPVEPIRTQPALPVQSVKPLRICKREGAASKTDLSQLPTPSSESSLKSQHCASTGHTDGGRVTTQHHKSISGSSSEWEYLDSLGEVAASPQGVTSAERPVASSATTGSFGNLMRGGLSTSDSRSLPVLDNIWGSFVSETAFGSSLPPSPATSISATYAQHLTNKIGYNSIDTRGPGGISRLSVQHHKSQSISPSSVSQSSSQCTPVPGTPVAVPSSAVNLTASYLGSSNGSFVTSGPRVRMPREGRVVSDPILGKFPPVSSNPVWPYEEEKTIGVLDNQDAIEGDLREELLLTPPVTPAWVAHVFDVDAEDNLQFSRMGYSESSDSIPLARMGNFAQMRRQKRGDMRSSSTQFPAEHSRRSDMLLPDPKKAGTRSNNPSKNAAFLARNDL